MHIKMSVSRFGSSSENQSFESVDKNYVDQKFRTLSTNLALKINQIGDTLTFIYLTLIFIYLVKTITRDSLE